ncbi:SGNH/GDSL hydrolase family protein [Enterobacter sp. Bisph1]|uniref:SGNH/GDSL hydrolase family protein n=1 Tax=Enterobacter sp. Bisph1 TaxID=1274399 RepID=UPI000690B9E6|nr:SGNH/GDSL hydrolase family protein [Enterobacter sp. Bisph1]
MKKSVTKCFALLVCVIPTITYADVISSTTIKPPEDSASPAAQNHDYTYIKCAYRKYIDRPYDVSSSWMWGHKDNKYAIVHGKWYSDALLANMFFTQASAQDLYNVCYDTLTKSGVTFSDIYPYAADFSLSYYYTFWSQGDDLPVVKVGSTELDRMVIFGDSLSDTINVYNGSYGTVPNRTSWYFGHFSNGLIWHEYLVRKHITIPDYTWATGNAESGKGIIFYGLHQQMDSFEAYARYSKGYAIDKTLFFIFFGGNDLINDRKKPEEIIGNYSTEIPRLIADGAKQIVLFTLPDFSKVPAVQSRSEYEKKLLQQNVYTFNNMLTALVTSLKKDHPEVKFITADLFTYFEKLINNPVEYGYANNKDTCLKMSGSKIDYFTGRKPTADCVKTKAAYMFWDNMHPTTMTHQYISEMLYPDLERAL